MIKITKKQNCSGCHACLNICPKQCISMNTDYEGFWYPSIDTNKCINCNLCEKVCSIYNDLNKIDNKMIAYACKNTNEQIRNTSSSGGVFTLLCEYIIKSGGVVFGAAFNESFEVEHMHAETLEECFKFRGSKYVQSKIGNTYKEAKKYLDEGKLVLFSGTPCQISSLDLFLMKKYKNLLMIDIACHGVPSPLVYKKYLKSLEDINKSKVSSLSFRDKTTGWKNYSFKLGFKNGKTIKEIGYDNIYMRGFLSDIYLRPSCYNCKSKKPTTSADITLADYWGIQNIHPDFDDDKGVSLVLVNTKLGQDIMKKLSSNMNIIKSDLDYALKCNPSIEIASKRNYKRKEFFEELNYSQIEKCIYKYTKINFLKRLKRKISNILYRIKKAISI